MNTAVRVTDEQVARAKASPLLGAVSADVALKKTGGEWTGLCPFHSERTGSFTVAPKKGFFHCFGCGAHGDVIAWTMRRRGLDFADAVRFLAGDDLSPRAAAPKLPTAAPRAADSRADKARMVRAARDIWAASGPASGTPAEAYLIARGIQPWRLPGGVLPPSLRFHPSLPLGPRRDGMSLPAMVAGMQDAAGRVVGVHRTYLAARNGIWAKAPVERPKRMLGEAWGAAIRLAPAAARTGVAEGIETGLSVLVSIALPVWVAGSLGNIAGNGHPRGPRRRHPVRDDKFLPTRKPDLDAPALVLPACVRVPVLLRDADGDIPTGDALVARACWRWRAEGRTPCVASPPAGMDFNDWLRTAPGEAGIGAAVEEAA